VAWVTVSLSDGIALLTIDRPPANALNTELMGELADAFRELATAPPAALVVAGRPGCFCAGADLKAFPGYDEAQRRRTLGLASDAFIRAYSLECPVVGAVTGHAIAGGLVLALCSDHRVVSSEGKYGLTEVKAGVPYPRAAMRLVCAELSAPTARNLILGNRLADAPDCVRLGVFDEVAAPEKVVGRAIEIAHELASLPGELYAQTKRDMRRLTLAEMVSSAGSDPLFAS
jgi:enoyl-CoA hydratase